MIKTPLSTVIGGAFWTPKATIVRGASKTFNQLIKSLFANGEQGFFYDPNDLSTMYQDAAGTVPVTAVGQPVGLLLDKSKGLVVGSELVVNGGFNDTTKWIKDTGWSVSGGVGVATNVVSGNIFQVIQSTVGKAYLISGTVVTRSSGSVRLLVDNTDIPIVTTSAPKTFSYIVRASAPNIQTGFRSTDGFTGTVDNVSVKELAGNHAYQTTSASRPILRQNATTGAYYLEFDGVDDHLTTSSFPAMGLATTIFAGSKANNSGTGAVVSRGAAGYVYQTQTQVTIQSVANPVSVPINGNTVITAKYEASGTGASLKVNSVLKTNQLTTDRGYSNSNPVVIGAFNTAGSASLSGHIYSLIGIGRLTTDSETVSIEKELARRTGVTLSV